MDLITVRGMRLLQKADVIIYAGSLVNPELLEYADGNCRIYDSAKMTLDEVIEVIEGAECEGLMTVRLHTGEPSIYGAVRENMEYTLPGVAQSLIITRMAGRTGGVPETESIESFAAHKASMAIYLSTGMLDELTERLITGGYTSDTPAARVYKATWKDEQAYVCTLGSLADTAEKYNITKTALVIVGEAVTHRNYMKSRLYAPDFETEFRKAKMHRETE